MSRGSGSADARSSTDQTQNKPLSPGARHRKYARQLETFGNSSTTDIGYSTALRKSLLENYDKNSYPYEEFWSSAGNQSRTGIPVSVGINFHKIFDVDISAHTLDLKVWLRMSWTDPRLAWDPEEFGNITKTWFWAEGLVGSENSEIYVPDLYLWNQEEPISGTLEDAFIIVTSSGSAFWSRPGHLKSACKYLGLEKFPYDSLKCILELGSWSKSGIYIRPVRYEGTGYSIGGSETAGESFSEFALAGVDCTEHAYPPFPNAPEEDWPVLLYEVTIDRASQPYTRDYILLQILLNICGFCCFWIRPDVGERMGLAITSLLAIVASDLSVNDALPTFGEMYWFGTFTIVCVFFSTAIVIQSTAVVFFYFYTGDTLEPSWFKKLKKRSRGNVKTDDSPKHLDETDKTSKSSNGSFRRINWASDVIIEEEPSGEMSGEMPLEHIAVGRRRRCKSIGSWTDRERKNNRHWQDVSSTIDEASRVIFPALYALFLAIIFPSASW